MKIISARITKMPKDFFDPMPQVFVTTKDGEEHYLYEYYPDEISFRSNEFIGLSLSDAKNLKFIKDKQYLQS